MSVAVLGLMVALLNEVNESSYYKDKHVSCTSDSEGALILTLTHNPSQVQKGWCDDYYKKCDKDDYDKSCSDSVCRRSSPDSSSDYT